MLRTARIGTYLDVRLFEIRKAQHSDVEEGFLVLVVLVAGDGPSVWAIYWLLNVGDFFSDFIEIELKAVVDVWVLDERGKPVLGLVGIR